MDASKRKTSANPKPAKKPKIVSAEIHENPIDVVLNDGQDSIQVIPETPPYNTRVEVLEDEMVALRETVSGLSENVRDLLNHLVQGNPVDKSSNPTGKPPNKNVRVTSIFPSQGLQTGAAGVIPTHELQTEGDAETTASVSGVFPTPGTEVVSTASGVDPTHSTPPSSTSNVQSDSIFAKFTIEERPILFSGGLPLGSQIPEKIKELILNDKFVDFHDIVNPDVPNAYTMAMLGNNTSPELGFCRKKKRPLSETEWSSAWDEYMSVYVGKFPDKMNDLLTYGRSIKAMMSHKIDWNYYDTQFRKSREYSKCSWTAIRIDLQLAASTFRNGNNSEARNKTGEQYKKSTRVPAGYCFKFHDRNQRCEARDCNYKHYCPDCKKPHPIYFGCRSQAYKHRSPHREGENRRSRSPPRKNAITYPTKSAKSTPRRSP